MLHNPHNNPKHGHCSITRLMQAAIEPFLGIQNTSLQLQRSELNLWSAIQSWLSCCVDTTRFITSRGTASGSWQWLLVMAWSNGMFESIFSPSWTHGKKNTLHRLVGTAWPLSVSWFHLPAWPFYQAVLLQHLRRKSEATQIASAHPVFEVCASQCQGILCLPGWKLKHQYH